jgi:hypothetical protein
MMLIFIKLEGDQPSPEDMIHQEAVNRISFDYELAYQIAPSSGQLAFTYCQIPVVYQTVSTSVIFKNGKEQVFEGKRSLSEELTKSVFDRKFEIVRITVDMDA